MIGEVLFGRYRVDELLGPHAGGQVYRGADLHAFAPIHIKLWPRDEDPGQALMEGEAMAAVRHPGVVRLVDFGLHEGRQPCLVMEGVVGETLAERLRAVGFLPWTEAFELGARVLDGLAALHEQGLVHRDVTPRSVVLLSDGRVKLVGLGHVTVAGTDDDRLASAAHDRSEPELEAPEYKAPEQLSGTGVHPGTDLYALAVVLWEAISGASPFAREPLRVATRAGFRPEFDELPDGAPELPVAARFALDRMLRASALQREADARLCARRLRSTLEIASRSAGLTLAS